MSFLAIDGDNVGQVFERLVIEQRTADITSFAASVRSQIERFRACIEADGGCVIIAEGDTVIAEIPGGVSAHLLAMMPVKKPVTFSCGVGATLREAWVALRYAKTQKPGAVFLFDGAFRRAVLDCGGDAQDGADS